MVTLTSDLWLRWCLSLGGRRLSAPLIGRPIKFLLLLLQLLVSLRKTPTSKLGSQPISLLSSVLYMGGVSDDAETSPSVMLSLNSWTEADVTSASWQRKGTGTFWDFPELSRTFWDLLGPSGTFLDLPGPSWTFQDLPGPSWTSLDRPGPSDLQCSASRSSSIGI